MKLSAVVSCTCFLSAVLISTYAAPASTGLEVSASASSGSNSGGGLGGLLQNIDLPGLLQGVNSLVKLVGVFCPPLSQVLDNVIQNVTSTAFRVFGRIILRSGGLGGNGGSSGGGGQKVNVVLPTFPPDEDYDDEEEESTSESISTTLLPNNLNQRAAENFETSGQISDSLSINLNGNIPEAGPDGSSPLLESDSSNTIAKRHLRVRREAEAEKAEDTNAAEDTDQEGAESAPSPDEEANIDDQDRLKRFLPWGGDGHDEDHGAGGGSGNFLFDIIRNTADRAARAVGTVYRMVAGTQHLIIGGPKENPTDDDIELIDSTATLDDSQTRPRILTAASSLIPTKLVAGSGASEDSDEKEHGAGGVAEIDLQGHPNGEGIPGPITRFFVIANRGLANVIQDLILRLAQTSERLVNFKARLITSLI